jgi:ABC-type multidrug transport system fused ATPase/permease subunit
MLFRPRAKLQPLRLLWRALSPKRRKQLLALQVLSLLAALGEVANIGVLLPFLRLLANPQEALQALGPLAQPLRVLPSQHLLLSLGLAFMLVVVLSTTVRVFTIRFQLRLAAWITADMGERVYAAVLARPYAWHLANNSSTVITYLTQDVNAVNSCVQAMLLLGMNLLIVVLLGGSLIALAPVVMCTVGLLLTGFYVLVFRFTRGTLRSDGRLQLLSYQASVQVAQEGLGGIRDVLLDRTQPFFVAAYRGHNERQKLAAAAVNIKAQLPRYLIEGFSMLVIVGVSLSMALAGQGIATQLPLLGALALGAYRLLQPLQQCFAAVSGLQANQVALARLEPFITQPVQASAPTAIAAPPPSPAGHPLVSLEGLCFRYGSDGPWVLEDLNLAIQPGERLAFVGSTGSGKSTCSDVILGLLVPSLGSIKVEGRDLHRSPGGVAAWQRRVAHVPQQIYLSDASFAANIAFGVPEDRINPERVRRAAQQARIAELIESSCDGYDTLVGERGVRLSGGQRQRIGIARALYKQAELLVLDEATSALDNRTEAEVMEAVQALDRRITVVLIAHRLSTVENCDRIVLLEGGRLKGIGSFMELKANNEGFMNLAGTSHGSLG